MCGIVKNKPTHRCDAQSDEKKLLKKLLCISSFCNYGTMYVVL